MHKHGGFVMRSPQEILEDLRAMVVELDCTLDEARAVGALMSVERIEARNQETMGKIEKHWATVEAWIMSQHSGDKQAQAEFESVLKRQGIVKTK
jgi:hypothetical protein